MSFIFSPTEDSFLTIVTATYNSSKYIVKCIKSLQIACSNVSNFQMSHIVIDGCSTDGTSDLIKINSPSSQIFFREKKGIYDALNYGISLVKSPYVMYLHSDDEIDVNFIKEMLFIINNNILAEEVICYGTVDFINNISKILFSRKPPFYMNIIQKYINIIFHPNAIYSTSLEKRYPYNLNIGINADHEHILEIAKQAKIIRVPKARYRFRISNESSTAKAIKIKTTFKLDKLPISVLKRYLNFFETKLLQRSWLKLMSKYSYWNLK